MSKVPSQAVFILDSPINAYLVSILAAKYDLVEVIYAIDPLVKAESEYLSIFRLLLSNVKISGETIFNYNSHDFWTVNREKVVQSLLEKLKVPLKNKKSDSVFFGNSMTNPVAAAAQRLVVINHLYHSPADFYFLLDKNKENLKKRFIKFCKKIVGQIVNRKASNIYLKGQPIYTLFDFSKSNNPEYFHNLSFMEFSNSEVEKVLRPLQSMVSTQENVTMLLLSGSEPQPGDSNPSEIELYLSPHLDAIDKLMEKENLKKLTIWIKEHKSYIPLNSRERKLITDNFELRGCEVFFISDIISPKIRLLPGECILRYCNFTYLIGEPSSMLLNIANGPTKSYAACSPFAPFRDSAQIQRNEEFIEINNLSLHSCNYF